MMLLAYECVVHGWVLVWWEQRVIADADRLQWAWMPLEGLGPLRFGISRDEVTDALGATCVSTGEDQEQPLGGLRQLLGVRTLLRQVLKTKV